MTGVASEPLQFASGDLLLDGHLARPLTSEPQQPALVLCHGFPTTEAAADAAVTYPDLADRIADSLGWIVLTFTFRGAGRSQGDFSPGGWLADIVAAVGVAGAQPRVDGVWLAGFGTGGALCLCAAAVRPEVRGVAVLGAPAGFEDWANHPRRLLQHAREVGLVHAGGNEQADPWVHQLRSLRPVDAAAQLADRPLLVIHGSEDEAVPHFDARVLTDAHGRAELRIITGAGHRLRHDPRAIAVLVGWLDRQKRHAGE